MHVLHMPQNFMAMHSPAGLEPPIPMRVWCSLGGHLEQVFIQIQILSIDSTL